MAELNHPNSLAPLATLVSVAPSLESSPNRTPGKTDVAIAIDDNDKTEVKFKTGTDTSSSSSAPVDDEGKPKIPDGGWGWVVVFSSLVLSMIADGISFSFGLLFVEFLKEFGASNSQTSWIGSLFLAVPLLTGPIMSSFVDKYGCRSMTILGGIVSAIGFILSYKVQSIGVMYLTFGIISGLGLGLCYVTAVVSIAFWFDKKRTLAVGLSAAGTGIGTFVFSPLTNLLLFEYGWRGTTLNLAGLLLNMCVCGTLMVDPDWIIEQNKQNSKLTKSGKSSKTSLESISSANPANSIDINELKKLLQSGKDTEYLLQTLETTMQPRSPAETANLKNVHNSLLNLPTYIKQNEKVPIEVLEQLSANKKLYNIILENYPSLLLCRSTSDKGLNKIAEDASLVDRVPVTFCMKLKKQDKPKGPIHQTSLPEDASVQEPLMGNDKNAKIPTSPPPRNASFPWLKQHLVQAQRQNYFKNIKLHRQSLVHRGTLFNINKYKLRASSCPNIYRVSMVTLAKEDEKWYTELLELVKGMTDFSLFLELHFLLMSLSTIILFVWFIVPYFYLATLMESVGYTNTDASYTISNIGITNTIGMIALGWAGDQPWMNLTKTYAICLVLCGVSCALIKYFVHNFIMLEISAGLFGVFLSSSFSFTPGILVELVPLDRFTVAYGLQLLCMGIGILVGPPYAGHLYDLTGQWDQPFYQAAIWTGLSGVLVALIPYTKNRNFIFDRPVEKEVEGSEDNVAYSATLLIILLVLFLIVMYFTIVCLI